MCVATIKCPQCGSATFNAPFARPANKWACTECNSIVTTEALLKGPEEKIIADAEKKAFKKLR
jgi:transcription initiation factor TFIIIB Brf1 subunit/transcription initiation factor TFIIB